MMDKRDDYTGLPEEYEGNWAAFAFEFGAFGEATKEREVRTDEG